MALRNLASARADKNDEFYTMLSDIESELKHYKKHFEGKVVYCNADDPYESNFFKYFALNFNTLKLKKLICTSYAGSPIVCTQLTLFGPEVIYEVSRPNKAWKIEITSAPKASDGSFDLKNKDFLNIVRNNAKLLKGDGDFRSNECVKLLKQADIVVSNPPFSLFRPYMNQLIENNKKFVIIGNMNALTYRETFNLIKNNKIWIGYTNPKQFICVGSERSNTFTKDGVKYAKFGNICWYTNLDIPKRNEEIFLYKEYKGHENEYPKFDNYEAINVDKTDYIPADYYGAMGVPISFIPRYNPNQFEIIGYGAGNGYRDINGKGLSAKFVEEYYANGGKGKYVVNHPILCYYDQNGKPIIPYMRIIIKRK